MASSKEYLDFVMEKLSGLEEVEYRPMMGEYILYYRGRIVGGIYDDRLLVKPVQAARALMPDAPEDLPYEGGSPRLLVEEVDDGAFLCGLFQAMYPQLPAPRRRQPRGSR